MSISLILSTFGRAAELARFLAYLDKQTFRDFELLVVDQNPDDRVDRVLDSRKSRFEIKHLRSRTGLCRAQRRSYECH